MENKKTRKKNLILEIIQFVK